MMNAILFIFVSNFFTSSLFLNSMLEGKVQSSQELLASLNQVCAMPQPKSSEFSLLSDVS